MTHPPLKVGVIGAGVGRVHLSGYQALGDEVEIVSLCDLDQVRLKEAGDKFNVPQRYTNVDKMLAAGEVDAVSVCLPNSLHAPVSIAALEAGLHVLCEKPLADTVTSAQKIVEAAATASTKFMICFNRRYRRDVQWMKKLVETGKLGRIYQVKAGWVREKGIPGGWFADKEMAGGGPLIDLGVHMLDSVMWLLDYPTPLTASGSVQANFGPRQLKTWATGPTKPYTVEDSALGFIRLAGDITLILETNWASHAKPGMDDFYITLMGTEGTLELYVANYTSENTLTLYTEESGAPMLIRPAVKGIPSDHTYAVAEFVKCIQEDTAPTAPAAQGLEIMKIIAAVYQSAQAGREVTLA